MSYHHFVPPFKQQKHTTTAEKITNNITSEMKRLPSELFMSDVEK